MICFQYYFWNFFDGFRVWDVCCLVELVCDLFVIDVLLSDIVELDEDYWFDNNFDQLILWWIVGYVKQIYDVDFIYLILLCVDGWIMDGMYCVCKVVLFGYQIICVKCFIVMLLYDYLGKGLDEFFYD